MARSTASAVFADTCGGSGCKSEDPPPLDNSVPVDKSTAPAAFILYLPVPPPR